MKPVKYPKRMSEFNCPMCEGELKSAPGTRIDPNDGVTLYCPNATCPAQEVEGHGRTEKDAFEIIKQKYHK